MIVYAIQQEKLTEDDRLAIRRYLNFFDNDNTESGYGRLINDESSLSRFFLRRIIESELVVENRRVSIGHNCYGKPYLIGFENFNFNISHSGEWIVVGIDEFELGVDIEKIKMIDYERVAKRFFAKSEQDFILKAPPDLRLENFYRLWCLKESFIKAEGIGLGIPLNSFSIQISELDGIRLEKPFRNKNHYFAEQIIDDKYRFAICRRFPIKQVQIKILKQSDLF